MKPISEEQIARKTNTAALPPKAPTAPRAAPRAPAPRALAPVPPPNHAPAPGAIQLTMGSLVGLVVVVAGVAAAVAVLMTRGL